VTPLPASTTAPASVVTPMRRIGSRFWLKMRTCSFTAWPVSYPAGLLYSNAMFRSWTRPSSESTFTPLTGGCWFSVCVT
jgi:hypothetical protein